MSQEDNLSESSTFVDCPKGLRRPPSLLVAPSSSVCAKLDCDGSSRFINFLQNLRDALAEHQEKKGISKLEQFGFLQLVGALIQNAVCAIVTIFIMVYSLLPLMETVLFLTRFILDKTIEISEAESNTEVIFKIVLFIFELTFITLMMMSMCAFIFFRCFIY